MKERVGKTVMFDKGVIDIVESHRRGNKKIPSFSDALSELIMLLNLDNDTRIRIAEYAKDCGIEMSEAYSDIIRVELEVVAQKK